MKKIFAIAAVCMLLLAGCGGKQPQETEPENKPDVVIPTGTGEAVVPEEGDIAIEIG